MTGATRAALLVAAGALLLAAAAVAALVQPSKTALPSVLAGVAALSFLLALVLERASLRRLVTARQARYGALAAGHAAAVLFILACVAFLAERHPLRADLTQDRRHTLEPTTLRILEAIPEGERVELVGVDLGGAMRPALAPLLKLFDEASQRVETRLLDAQAQPGEVRPLGLTRFPAILVRLHPADGGDPRSRQVEELREEDLARAIDEALRGELPVLAVLAGHGESALADASPSGFLAAGRRLEAESFAVRQVFLGADGVPEDAAALIVPGPESDLLASEVDALRQYQSQGGRILLLLGPTQVAGALPRLVQWLAEDWGVRLQEDLVADTEGLALFGDRLVLALRPDPSIGHPVVRGFDRIVVFPVARTITPEPLLPEGVKLDVLLRSSPSSWAETDTTQAPSFEEGDAKGPLPLGVAGTRLPFGQDREARLVAFGSSRFAGSAPLVQEGNAALLLDAVAWLTDQEDRIEARKASDRRDGTLVIPYQEGILIALTAAAIPLVVLLGGIATWLHRRRL